MDRLLLFMVMCAGAARGAPQDSAVAFDSTPPLELDEGGAQTASTERDQLVRYDDTTDSIDVVIDVTEPARSTPPKTEADGDTENPTSPRNEIERKTQLLITTTTEGRETERPTSPTAAIVTESSPSESKTERQKELATSPRSASVRTFSRAPRRPTRPGPRFLSKLSYFNKATSGAAAGNLLQSPGKETRRFKSRCRCEKIWNCPKLQITVPRCPDEYFLCCF